MKALVCAAVGSSLLAAAWFAWAGEMQILSVSPAGHGAVLAKVSLPAGETVQSTDFILHFDDARAFPAIEVKPALASQAETWVVLCVDQSGSMGRAVRDMKNALKGALSKLRPQLEVELIAFGTRTETLSGFSNDTAELLKSADTLAPEAARDGKTKLYEAIWGSLTNLKANPDPGPKRLIVISDGNDEGSSLGPEQLVRQAKSLGISMDGIGFGRLAGQSSGSLRSLADATGGKFVLVASAPELADVLDQFLIPELPPPVFDVAFKYEPSSDGRSVNSAILEYRRVGQNPQKQVLDGPIPAPKEAEHVAPAGDKSGGDTKAANEWKITLFDVSVDVKVLLALLAAATGLAVWRIIYRNRRGIVVPEPNAKSEPKTSPLPQPRPRARTVVSPVFPVPQKEQPAAFLVSINGPTRGQRYPIDQPMIRIGASATNDVFLSGDDYVSGEHARIKFDSGSLYLIDDNSRNGTFLNGTRLAQTAMVLGPGDQVRIGKTTLELHTT